MTTVNNTRQTTSIPTTSMTTPGADDGLIETQPTLTPVATFEAATARRAAPFGPPQSPRLTDERTAQSSSERERIRDENGERITGYNKQYAGYLETYTAAVESAPDLERVRQFGAPVPYAPQGSLPVDQRARYDDLQKPALANQKIVHEAIGERVLKERGERVPGLYGFLEGKVGLFGQTAKERFEIGREFSQDGAKAKTTLGYSMSSPVDTPIGKPKVSVSIDPDSGKAKGAASTKIGDAAFLGVEVDTDAKLTLELGVREKQQLLGTEGELFALVGSSWDPTAARAEAFLKTGAKVFDFDVEVKTGLGMQLLTKEYAAEVINPNAKGFFDDDRINALRSGGR